MQEQDPDAQRMLAFRAGDDSAFDALYERWSRPLLHFVERMVGDAGTAEELVQETFLRVYRARERYEPKARFSTWLYRIATNLALNELARPRRKHAHDGAATDELREGAASAERVVGSRRVGEQVEAALQQLPERQRVALWLCAVEERSHAEIAEVLGASEKSVKALVHRGRAALQSRLGFLRRGEG